MGEVDATTTRVTGDVLPRPGQTVPLRRRRLRHPVAPLGDSLQLPRRAVRPGARLRGAARPWRRRGVRHPSYDETNTRIRPERLARLMNRKRRTRDGHAGRRAVQPVPARPRLARPFRARDPGRASAASTSRAASRCCRNCRRTSSSEGSGRLPLRRRGRRAAGGSAAGRRMRRAQAVYNFMVDLPGSRGSRAVLPAEWIARTVGHGTSFDAGRGCPFQCCFCTIINVQGRKSRLRCPTTSNNRPGERRAGLNSFFITDDNFARNRNWEPIFDRLIELREKEGMRILFIHAGRHPLPQDPETSSRKRPGRCEARLHRAGEHQSRSLVGAQSARTRSPSTARCCWRGSVGALTYAGYILGFPNDTRDRSARHRDHPEELPVDLLEFFFLTPLPDRQDHQAAREGVAMDAGHEPLRPRSLNGAAPADVGRGLAGGLPHGLGRRTTRPSTSRRVMRRAPPVALQRAQGTAG